MNFKGLMALIQPGIKPVPGLAPSPVLSGYRRPCAIKGEGPGRARAARLVATLFAAAGRDVTAVR